MMITNSLDAPSQLSEITKTIDCGSVDAVSESPSRPPKMRVTLNPEVMRETLEELEVSEDEKAKIEAALLEPSVSLSELLGRK